VTFTITAYAAFTDAHAPCVGIGQRAVKNPPGDKFETCGDGAIHDYQHGTTAGHASVKRPDSSTIVYAFSRKLLGDKISSQVQVRYGNCLQLNGKCDQAPDGPGTHLVQTL
jgi:hypothetical protein